VTDWSLDPAEYRKFFAQAGYRERHAAYYPTNIHEKSLEHFIAQKLLGLSESDTYVDVASEHSPVPEIYGRLYGCSTYAQDLSYPPGLHGTRIGGSAAAMPVTAGFATKMALHCSFEHFEGTADAGFVRECARVLAPGGVAVVVPLYLNDVYAVQTNPVTSLLSPVPFEEDAIVCCDRKWKNRHARFYDARHLHKLLADNAAGLTCSVFRILNPDAVHPSCYAWFALRIVKPTAGGAKTPA
jgi:hypothetical protein